jgi:hypothetical protein
MINKHFFKFLFGFIAIIAVSIIIMLVVSQMDNSNNGGGASFLGNSINQ